MNRAELEGLLERVETGKALNEDFVRLHSPDGWVWKPDWSSGTLYIRRPDKPSKIGSDGEADYEIIPRFTASIDAALALVERVLPGSRCSVVIGDGWATVHLSVHFAPMAVATAKTGALAILAALLKALISQPQQKIG